MVMIGSLGIFSSFNLNRNLVESSSGFLFELGRMFSAKEGVRYRYNGSIIWQDIPQLKSESINAGDAVFTATNSTADISLKAGSNFQVQPNSLIIFKPPVVLKDKKTKSSPLISIQQGSIKLSSPSATEDPLMIEINGKTYFVPAETNKIPQTMTITVSDSGAAPRAVIENKEVLSINKSMSIEPITQVELVEVTLAEKKDVSLAVEKQVDSKSNSVINEVSISLVNTKIGFNKTDLPSHELGTAETAMPRPVVSEQIHQVQTTRQSLWRIKKIDRKIAQGAVPSPTPTASVEMGVLMIPPSPDSSFFKSAFSLGLGFDYFGIDSVDPSNGSQAKILSGISPDFTLGWKLEITPKSQVALNANVTQYKLQPLTNGASLLNDSGTKVSAEIEYKHRVQEDWLWGIALTMEEKLFLRSESISTLSADKVVIGAINTSLTYQWIKKSNGSIGMKGSIAYLLPASNQYFNIKPGSALSTGLYLRHDNDKHDQSCLFQLGYRLQSQDTALSDQKEQQISFSLTYEFSPW